MSYTQHEWTTGETITAAKLNNMEEGIAAGGGGLPAVTSADVGKGLSVQTVYTKGAVIVPEQTSAYNDQENGILSSNANISLYTSGTPFVAEINGSTYSGTITENGTAYCKNAFSYFWIEDTNLYYYDENATFGSNITISLNVGVPSYQWVADPYAAYDLVLKFDVELGSEAFSDNDIHIVKGTYADCVAKCRNYGCISIYAYNQDYTSDEDWGTVSYPILSGFTQDIGYNNCFEFRIAKSWIPGTNVRNSGNTGSVTIYGACEGSATRYFYFTESGVSMTAP